ncbi:MFS transporter [Mycobacterium kubicae]|uniref:MFS transporter n=1 Tax=Mycobacterium kubicae TaxID=120959 RepID=A0AAX1JDZ6_9MYCO|nr:sugar porter family MFS transporter [Mycobacterium kubicae]MCV7098011.1 sugar porter family MFS transporter [Mycobacterium kubicae]ORW05526.1 MFS transporter [Mycobacterium kubicae]QNI10384.1 sugar porter family MFS transporter [Mycobacterium kubicae]QPI38588.1 sugar porter family MFS transporter [Mycobacterium kubicae]GFG63590.1 MFS transporter [Mycobacterium kubicae]
MAAADKGAGGAVEHRRAAPRQLTGAVVFVALVPAISGALYGYDTGIISGALLQMTKDFGIAESWKQLIAASILVGAVIGALVSSHLAHKRGRKPTLVILAAVFVVGALWCALSPNPVLLSLGRLVLGFAVGGTLTAPTYVAELAPKNYRGRLVLCFQIAIGVGILIATLIGASQSIPWRWSIGIAAVPAALMLGLLLRLPESPRWLVKRGNVDDALDVLQRVRPPGYDIKAELQEMTESAQAEETAGTQGWPGLRERWVRPALILGCGYAIFTQLSGIEMIVYYSPTILTDNGFPTSVALDVSVGLGLSYLLAQLVGLSVVDKVGRRRLVLIMIPGAAVSLFVLGLLFVTGNSGRDSVPFIVACLIVFMLFNAGGLQLAGWVTGSEIFPLAVRPAGTAAQTAVMWATNVVITSTLLTLISGIGVGPTMWLYAMFNVGAWLFVFFRLPELTGRSLEEIEGKLAAGKFRPIDFARDR